MILVENNNIFIEERKQIDGNRRYWNSFHSFDNRI